ncbi:MAG: hypothetical protein PWQ70_3348 [Clostridiales bacterium]|nr:hypothetical protein [Clostridiales bacterium]
MSNNTDNDSKKRKAKAYIIVFIVSFVIWFIAGLIGFFVVDTITLDGYYYNPYTGEEGIFYDGLLFKALTSGIVGSVGFLLFAKIFIFKE